LNTYENLKFINKDTYRIATNPVIHSLNGNRDTDLSSLVTNRCYLQVYTSVLSINDTDEEYVVVRNTSVYDVFREGTCSNTKIFPCI
jgi:hypothetical protein